MSPAKIEPGQLAALAPTGVDIATDGSFAVSVATDLNDEEVVRILSHINSYEDSFNRAGMDSRWIAARAFIDGKDKYGDIVYQAVPMGKEQLFMKDLDVALEFSAEEVASLPELHFSHFKEVRFTARIDHGERMAILERARDQGLNARATRDFAKRYRDTRDGITPDQKPKFLIIDPDGTTSLKTELSRQDLGQKNRIFTVGAKPKEIIGIEPDGEPILEDIEVVLEV